MAMSVDPGWLNIIDLTGVWQTLSSTTRSGWRSKGVPSSSRAVRYGSSVSAVFTPTNMASQTRRICCTNPLASGPVTHLESPVWVAILPSSVMAYLTVTKGVPVVICLANAS